jgi:hypothetical protein
MKQPGAQRERTKRLAWNWTGGHFVCRGWQLGLISAKRLRASSVELLELGRQAADTDAAGSPGRSLPPGFSMDVRAFGAGARPRARALRVSLRRRLSLEFLEPRDGAEPRACHPVPRAAVPRHQSQVVTQTHVSQWWRTYSVHPPPRDERSCGPALQRPCSTRPAPGTKPLRTSPPAALPTRAAG